MPDSAESDISAARQRAAPADQSLPGTKNDPTQPFRLLLLERIKKFIQPLAIEALRRTEGTWHIFWMRADGRWHGYQPFPEAKSLAEALRVIDEDAHCCFFG